MKKSLIAGLVLAMVAGSLLSPAAGAKKKKKPKPPVVVEPVATDVSYFLRRISCGTADNETSLSIVDDVDEGDDCGAAESGLLTEAYVTTGQDPAPVPVPAVGNVDTGPDTTAFPASDGVPFVLDATKEIKGSIAVSSFCCGGPGISAGQATLDAVLTGTVDGEVKTIGEASVEYLVTPDKPAYEVEFAMTPDVALDKLTFTTLELSVTNRGVSYLNGFFSYDDPASWIVVGTWK